MSDLSPLDEQALALAGQRRKTHIRNREYWLAVQKSCNKETRDLARFASDEAKEHLQWEKAATWVISSTVGQSPSYTHSESKPEHWVLQKMPPELVNKIMQEYRCADYGIMVAYLDDNKSQADAVL